MAGSRLAAEAPSGGLHQHDHHNNHHEHIPSFSPLQRNKRKFLCTGATSPKRRCLEYNTPFSLPNPPLLKLHIPTHKQQKSTWRLPFPEPEDDYKTIRDDNLSNPLLSPTNSTMDMDLDVSQLDKDIPIAMTTSTLFQLSGYTPPASPSLPTPPAAAADAGYYITPTTTITTIKDVHIAYPPPPQTPDTTPPSTPACSSSASEGEYPTATTTAAAVPAAAVVLAPSAPIIPAAPSPSPSSYYTPNPILTQSLPPSNRQQPPELHEIPNPIPEAFLSQHCRPEGRRAEGPSYSFKDAVYIKYGPQVVESEALTLLLLASTPTGNDEGDVGVPVPTLYDYYRHPETGHWCILMQYIKGCETLEVAQAAAREGGSDKGGKDMMDRVVSQLHDVVRRLREVGGKGRGIGSLTSGGLVKALRRNGRRRRSSARILSGAEYLRQLQQEQRFYDNLHQDIVMEEEDEDEDEDEDMEGAEDDLGPIHDHFFTKSHILHGPFSGPLAYTDFIHDLAEAVQDRVIYEHQLDVVTEVAELAHPHYPGQQRGFHLTHNELVPRHILVDKTGTIRAIVDWSHAGFFPDYWEYVKAHFGSDGMEESEDESMEEQEEDAMMIDNITTTVSLSSSPPSSLASYYNCCPAATTRPSHPQRSGGVKRLDLIFRPDGVAMDKASVLLMARDVIY